MPPRCHSRRQLPSFFFACLLVHSVSPTKIRQQQSLVPGNHTRNAAVLVSSSRYWHNYRHVSNVLSLYNLLKTGGQFSDEDIILMIADDVPCDGRNPYKNAIYPDYARGGDGESVYGCDDINGIVEIDYRGTDVTVENFLGVLVGRNEDGDAPSRTLDLTPDTNLLVYLTGHGGDQFFKFQDGEELMVQDVAGAFQQMHKLGRYNEILFVADTCQAFSMNPTDPKVVPEVGLLPNVMTVASSLLSQNSYAHHSDPEIGQSVVDRYTYSFVEKLKNLAYHQPDSQVDLSLALWQTMEQTSVKSGWIESMSRKNLGADVGWTSRGCRRLMDTIPICDFLCDRQQNMINALRKEVEEDDIVLLTQKDETAGSAEAVQKILSNMKQSEGSATSDFD
mmetsp:Transcript_6085/g.13266  ORF Transcript_6085/g.13266 Transcript_6085/m.13266 type:complete len:392 (-) Transcript_6085:366-1541(-)|eukprot:CAMPEP_0178488382 /NCGR_PEP_ID=MMETSP0696-20121128/9829_1 /TAXON_ID=265572 /ORGANISM="Extubocellulus spinifer, Strain CCMP396" /LENGTH=391 /DNA_ID=CAMNT_0020116145 /DNA_START=99 /DNA_END=1274 /DNA_ORIENTATION=-